MRHSCRIWPEAGVPGICPCNPAWGCCATCSPSRQESRYCHLQPRQQSSKAVSQHSSHLWYQLGRPQASRGLSHADSVTVLKSSEVWYYTGAPGRHRKILTFSLVGCIYQQDVSTSGMLGQMFPDVLQLWTALTINTRTVSLRLAGVMPRHDSFIGSQNNLGWKEPLWKSLIQHSSKQSQFRSDCPGHLSSQVLNISKD